MEMQAYLMENAARESDEVSENIRLARNSRTWGTSENLILFMALPYRPTSIPDHSYAQTIFF